QTTGVIPPPCRVDETLPETMEFPVALADDKRVAGESFYKTYLATCRRAQEESKSQPLRGLMKEAFDEWQAARDESAKLDQTVDEAERNKEIKKAAYDEALAKLVKAQESGPEAREKLKRDAALLKQDFEVASGIANSIANKNAALA